MLHKKAPARVFIMPQPTHKLAVLTVASAPPIGEYGRQKARIRRDNSPREVAERIRREKSPREFAEIIRREKSPRESTA